MRRILTAAVLAFAVGSSAGCAPAEPPAVSSKVAAYYEANKTVEPLPTGHASAFTAEAVRALVKSNKNLVIQVSGDSTGNALGEWVDLWAQHLAGNATVTLHLWDEAAEMWDAEPVVYGEGARNIEIWNGSMPGSAVSYGTEHIKAFQPVKPDLMILNYGHNQGDARVDQALFEYVEATKKRWKATVPTVITLQNPAQGVRRVSSLRSYNFASSWASSTGYPVVDVTEAFAAKPRLAALLLDEVHPNGAGSRVWADAVTAALG